MPGTGTLRLTGCEIETDGYCDAQQKTRAEKRETKKREQWAEILFRQAKEWLTERGRKTAILSSRAWGYARSTAEQAAERGATHRDTLRRIVGFR
jgi:hypothetical protein